MDTGQRARWTANNHHRETADLGAGLCITEMRGIAHPVWLDALPVSSKPIFN